MSDYKHQKVIRIPFPKEFLKKCNTEDPYDCESYLKEKLGEFWEHKDNNSFTLECTDKAYYIDWVYYYTYGEESGDWGSVRLLTDKELEVIRPYFDKIGVVYEDEDLRLVDYCYYNCSEPSDYYKLNGDDSSIFISND
jgi:hypothetical protein